MAKLSLSALSPGDAAAIGAAIPVGGRRPGRTTPTKPVCRRTGTGHRRLLTAAWALAGTTPVLAVPPLSLGLQTMTGPAAALHALPALPANSTTQPGPGGSTLDALLQHVAGAVNWPIGTLLNPLSPLASTGTTANRLAGGSSSVLAPPNPVSGKSHPLGGMPPQRERDPSPQDLPSVDLYAPHPSGKETPPVGSVPRDNRSAPHL